MLRFHPKCSLICLIFIYCHHTRNQCKIKPTTVVGFFLFASDPCGKLASGGRCLVHLFPDTILISPMGLYLLPFLQLHFIFSKCNFISTMLESACSESACFTCQLEICLNNITKYLLSYIHISNYFYSFINTTTGVYMLLQRHPRRRTKSSDFC